ncbi:MAG: hypothetical protein IJG80_07520 [Selenomonadaceae bacterium]|nr:hypothetical protein [Selenomonadaceae bacterium]
MIPMIKAITLFVDNLSRARRFVKTQAFESTGKFFVARRKILIDRIKSV